MRSLPASLRSTGLHPLQCLLTLPTKTFMSTRFPTVSSADRQAMLSHKLGQHFYGNTYTAALQPGAKKTGRGHERMLFAVITEPAVLDPWIEALSKPGQVSGCTRYAYRPHARTSVPGWDAALLMNLRQPGCRQNFSTTEAAFQPPHRQP